MGTQATEAPAAGNRSAALNLDSNSELYKLKDTVGEILDLTRSNAAELKDVSKLKDELSLTREDLAQARAVLAVSEQKFTEVDRRLDFLDQNRGRGAKGGYAENGHNYRDRAMRALGKIATMARRYPNGALPEIEIPLFGRAQLQRAQRILSEDGGTDGSAGGVGVPIDLIDDVFRYIADESMTMKLCRIVETDSDKYQIPTFLGGFSTEYLADNTTSNATDQFADTSLEQRANSQGDIETLVCYGAMSKNLREDARVRMEAVIGEMMAESVAARHNQALTVANGGADKFTGIFFAANVGEHVLSNANQASHDSFSDISDWDLRKGLQKIKANHRGRAVLLGHADIYSEITGIVDSNNRPIFRENVGLPTSDPAGSPQTSIPAGYVKGRAFWSVDAAPNIGDDDGDKVFLCGGDLKRCVVMGLRKELEVEWSHEVLFLRRQSAVMTTTRFGIEVWLPSGLTRWKTAADNT